MNKIIALLKRLIGWVTPPPVCVVTPPPVLPPAPPIVEADVVLNDVLLDDAIPGELPIEPGDYTPVTAKELSKMSKKSLERLAIDTHMLVKRGEKKADLVKRLYRHLSK